MTFERGTVFRTERRWFRVVALSKDGQTVYARRCLRGGRNAPFWVRDYVRQPQAFRTSELAERVQ